MNSALATDEVQKLQEKLQGVYLPKDLQEKIQEMLDRLARAAQVGSLGPEYDSIANYIGWVKTLPWDKHTKDILDLNNARTVLSKNHFGLNEVKNRILEYMAVLIIKESDQESRNRETKLSRAPILCLVGLVGTGKTTLAYSIAEAMGRKFERIPFGGMGDALYLRGESRAHPDAEPGQVIKALKRCGSKNPVILLDEIDRVAEDARSTIMGVLVELLDPEQNSAFTDHFIDYPFDLSEVLFIATANNTTNISTAVLDRLEPIQMPSYSDEEKITIAKDFVLPRILKEIGISKDKIAIEDAVWPKIVRPLGFDAGIRTLERTIEGIVRKISLKIAEGKGNSFHITEENVKEYLPSW